MVIVSGVRPAVLVAALALVVRSLAGLWVAALVLTSQIALHAAPDPKPRLIGLLNLPEIYATAVLVMKPCGADTGVSAALYRSPSTRTKPIGSIILQAYRIPENGLCGSPTLMFTRAGHADIQLPVRELDDEQGAAIVYQRLGSWFRIAVPGSWAWSKREHATDFVSYPEVLREKVSYFTEGWDRRLWREPASAALVAFGSGWKALKRRNIAVELLGIRRLANDTWLRVRLTELDDYGEEVKQGRLKPVVGWIPAYRLSGETSLWYYARD
jgi:hypothetical protein